MVRELTIAGRRIADDEPAYCIAEIGHNHGGEVAVADDLITRFADAGADAVKLQKRDNRALYTRAMYDEPYQCVNSFAPTYGAHRDALELSPVQLARLRLTAAIREVAFFATAFDPASADELAALAVPAFKIASGDLTNTPLIRHVAAHGKPVILSTGGATLRDVCRAYEAALTGTDEVAILHCVAAYPAADGDLNLRAIETLRAYFPEAVIGWSGHEPGTALSVAAYALGARIIEKHVTLDKAAKGTDHAFSLLPAEFEQLVSDLDRLHTALGDGVKVPRPSEAAALRKMGKSIYSARALPAGHVLTEADLALKSPGGHLPPYERDRLVGRVLTVAVGAEEPLALALVEDRQKVGA